MFTDSASGLVCWAIFTSPKACECMVTRFHATTNFRFRFNFRGVIHEFAELALKR